MAKPPTNFACNLANAQAISARVQEDWGGQGQVYGS